MKFIDAELKVPEGFELVFLSLCCIAISGIYVLALKFGLFKNDLSSKGFYLAMILGLVAGSINVSVRKSPIAFIVMLLVVEAAYAFFY